MLALAIKRYENGTASTWMHDREVGDDITISMLGGNLYLHDLDRDTVFLRGVEENRIITEGWESDAV